MEANELLNLIKDNSVVGATGSMALVFLYKIWRIIQSDRKEDNHDHAEREFREEMRIDIKELRELLKTCEYDKNVLNSEVNQLKIKMADFNAKIRICQLSTVRPDKCPLLEK